jgi:DNA-binding transcriptional ArsR family regulator
MLIHSMIETESTPRTDADLCDVELVDPDRVRRLRLELPDPDRLGDLSEIFRACADPTRLKLLLALSRDEMCVCDLAATVDASPSGVSHHLRLLRTLRLARSRRDGRMVYYRLDDDHVKGLLDVALAHLAHR